MLCDLQVGLTGKLYGIDHIPELVEESIANVEKGNKDLLSSGIVELHSK